MEVYQAPRMQAHFPLVHGCMLMQVYWKYKPQLTSTVQRPKISGIWFQTTPPNPSVKQGVCSPSLVPTLRPHPSLHMKGVASETSLASCTVVRQGTEVGPCQCVRAQGGGEWDDT